MDSAKEEQPANGKGPQTAEQKRAERERQGLMMARARVLQQLEASSNDAYVRSLRQALSDLEEKLKKMKQ
jgi:polyhydroxyalkanoate synthesis regulator phasin